MIPSTPPSNAASAYAAPVHGTDAPPADLAQPQEMRVRRPCASQFASLAAASIVIMGITGAQGSTFTFRASQTYESHGRTILAPVRGSVEAAMRTQVTDEHQVVHELGAMPGVRVIPAATLKEYDPTNMIVVATVPSQALGAVLANLPAQPHAVFATYNGVPPELPQGIREPAHMVSLLPSFPTAGHAGSYSYRPGQVLVDQSLNVARDIQAIFQVGNLKVNLVPDALAAQWSKIGANTVANSLATLFGIQVCDLRQMIENNPSTAWLVEGLCAEISTVAQHEGVNVSTDSFHQGVLAKIPPDMQHFTSTGNTFRAGKSLQSDIETLSAGVSRLAHSANARAHIETPLCDALTKALTTLEALRGAEAPLPQDFYARDDVAALKDALHSPETMALAQRSIDQAKAQEAAAMPQGKRKAEALAAQDAKRLKIEA